MTSARDEILAAVRGAVTNGKHRRDRATIDANVQTHGRGLIPARASDAADLADLFEAQITAVHATVHRVATMADVPSALATYLQQQNLPAELVMAPDPTLDAAPWDSVPLVQVRRGVPNTDDMVGVSSAFAAVAETGTLVATSGPDHPSTLNFVPDTHVVVLPADRVVASYEDAWDQLRAMAGDDPLPRTINMISGPSRTGDIEQNLTLGAHGPRRLHVILVDDDGRA